MPTLPELLGESLKLPSSSVYGQAPDPSQQKALTDSKILYTWTEASEEAVDEWFESFDSKHVRSEVENASFNRRIACLELSAPDHTQQVTWFSGQAEPQRCPVNWPQSSCLVFLNKVEIPCHDMGDRSVDCARSPSLA
jgi:hypothetical protein